MISSVSNGNNCLLLFICNDSNKPGCPSFVCIKSFFGSSKIKNKKNYFCFK